MSDAHSKASKERMAKFSKEELSHRMTAMAHAKNKKMTREERVAHANMMVEARRKVKHE